MSGVIKGNQDQFKKLAANSNESPVVMLNLLKFKKEGGQETYFRYVKESGPYVQSVGGKVLYFGKANELLYGTEAWDVVMLVHYPSRKAFLQMANDPGYRRVHKLREQALERAVLYSTDPVQFKELLAESNT